MGTNPNLAALQAAYETALAASQAAPDNADLAKAADDAKAALAAAQVDAAPNVKGGKVEVRVLRDEGDFKIDTVATLSADEATIAVRDGWADADPVAVAFIKKENAAKG